MRKISFIVLLFACQLVLSQVNPPQNYKPYNRFSLEVAAGYHLPVSPITDGNSAGSLSGMQQFNLAGRFMINDLWGVKGQYAFYRFQDRDNRDMGNSFNSFSLEAVMNILRAMDKPKYVLENYALLLHAGFGFTLAYPDSRKDYSGSGLVLFDPNDRSERMFNLLIGVTPTFKLTEHVAFMADISYIVNTQQQYGYNGELIYSDMTKVTGGFMNFGVGVVFMLGNRTSHADFY